MLIDDREQARQRRKIQPRVLITATIESSWRGDDRRTARAGAAAGLAKATGIYAVVVVSECLLPVFRDDSDSVDCSLSHRSHALWVDSALSAAAQI